MRAWKIQIFGDEADLNTVCCTVVIRAVNEAEAVLLARDHALELPVHSRKLRAVSCGQASDSEAEVLKDGEGIALVMYKSLHGAS